MSDISLEAKFLAHMSNGVMIWNEAGRIVYANEAMASLCGCSVCELLGTRVLRLTKFQKVISQIKRDIVAAGSAEVVIHSGKRSRRFDLSVSSFYQGESRYFGMIATDLTVLRETHRRKARGERLSALGILTAGLAHELRNGLHGVRGFADILEEETRSNLPLNRLAAGIKEDAERLTRLVNNFLLFAKKPELEMEKVNLKELLETSVNLVERLPNFTTISFEKNLPFNQWVKGDKDRLYQVLINLLLNAGEAQGTDTIKVSLDSKPEGAEIVIEDNGNGIRKKDVEKIFDPFYTTKPGGTGLGLSIAHQIVKEHGGTIDIKNTGYGTRVIVQLPREEV